MAKATRKAKAETTAADDEAKAAAAKAAQDKAAADQAEADKAAAAEADKAADDGAGKADESKGKSLEGQARPGADDKPPPEGVAAGAEVVDPAVTVSPEDAAKVTKDLAEPAPAEAIRDAITSAQEDEADPSAPVPSLAADPFEAAQPKDLTDAEAGAMDFGAIVRMGLDTIDEIDTGLTSSAALADARTALERARDLVSGFASGKLA